MKLTSKDREELRKALYYVEKARESRRHTVGEPVATVLVEISFLDNAIERLGRFLATH